MGISLSDLNKYVMCETHHSALWIMQEVALKIDFAQFVINQG